MRQKREGAIRIKNKDPKDCKDSKDNSFDVFSVLDVPGVDPDVVVRVDRGPTGAPVEVSGARTWAQGAVAFAQHARFAQPALVDGAVGLVMAPRGRLFRAVVEVISDPERLRQLDLAVLDDGGERMSSF